jgi:hypothetical protein
VVHPHSASLLLAVTDNVAGFSDWRKLFRKLMRRLVAWQTHSQLLLDPHLLLINILCKTALLSTVAKTHKENRNVMLTDLVKKF